MDNNEKDKQSWFFISDLYIGLSEHGQHRLVRALIDQLPHEQENTERVLRSLLQSVSRPAT